jgi:hypothetical protein
MLSNALCSVSHLIYGARIPKHAACPTQINTGESAGAWGERGGGVKGGGGVEGGGGVKYTSSLLNDVPINALCSTEIYLLCEFGWRADEGLNTCINIDVMHPPPSPPFLFGALIKSYLLHSMSHPFPVPDTLFCQKGLGQKKKFVF